MKRLSYAASIGVLAAGVLYALCLLFAAYSFGRLLADTDDLWYHRVVSLAFYLLVTLMAVMTRRAVGELYQKDESDVR